MTSKRLQNEIKKITFEHLKHKNYLKRDKYKDKSGNKKVNAAMESERVYLAFAYNMAYENYSMFRGKNQDNPNAFNRLYTTADCPASLIEMMYIHNPEIKLLLKEQKNEAINKILETEHLVFKYITAMRNYHSHIIHEPGAPQFKDFFDVKTYPGKKDKLSENDLETVKKYLNDKFDFAKLTKLNYINDLKENIDN